MEATPRGSGAWTMRLTNVTPERFDVPDNSDEAPRLSERAPARYVTSGHAVQTVKAAKAGGAPREAAFIDRTFVTMCTIGRFLGVSAMFSPARRRRGVAVDAPSSLSLARARRDQCRGGGAAIAARATARAT
jgi:hypothetical protein